MAAAAAHQEFNRCQCHSLSSTVGHPHHSPPCCCLICCSSCCLSCWRSWSCWHCCCCWSCPPLLSPCLRKCRHYLGGEHQLRPASWLYAHVDAWASAHYYALPPHHQANPPHQQPMINQCPSCAVVEQALDAQANPCKRNPSRSEEPPYHAPAPAADTPSSS